MLALEGGSADGSRPQLVALKRLAAPGGGARTVSTALQFATPEDAGPAEMTLHLVADAVVGLDCVAEPLRFQCEGVLAG